MELQDLTAGSTDFDADDAENDLLAVGKKVHIALADIWSNLSICPRYDGSAFCAAKSLGGTGRSSSDIFISRLGFYARFGLGRRNFHFQE